jgi:hypothetical protein
MRSTNANRWVVAVATLLFLVVAGNASAISPDDAKLSDFLGFEQDYTQRLTQITERWDRFVNQAAMRRATEIHESLQQFDQFIAAQVATQEATVEAALERFDQFMTTRDATASATEHGDSWYARATGAVRNALAHDELSVVWIDLPDVNLPYMGQVTVAVAAGGGPQPPLPTYTLPLFAEFVAASRALAVGDATERAQHYGVRSAYRDVVAEFLIATRTDAAKITCTEIFVHYDAAAAGAGEVASFLNQDGIKEALCRDLVNQVLFRERGHEVPVTLTAVLYLAAVYGIEVNFSIDLRYC